MVELRNPAPIARIARIARIDPLLRIAPLALGTLRTLLAALVCSFFVLPGHLAAADDDLSPREIRRTLLDDYDVLVVRSGLVLTPHDDSEFKSLELVGEDIFIDGEKSSRRELRELAGDETADAIRALSALDPAAQRDLFSNAPASEAGRSRGLPEPPAPPVAPAAPGAPSAPSAPSAAEAPEAPSRSSRRRESSRVHEGPQVTVGGSVHIESGQIAEDALAVGGVVEVAHGGEVQGDAVAVGGSVTIDGLVTGDAVSVGGTVTLGPDAEVEGNVVSVGGTVNRAETAKIGGRVEEVGSILSLSGLRLGRSWKGDHGLRTGISIDDDDDDTFWERGMGFIGRLFKMAFYGLLVCLALLLLPRPIERMRQAMVRDPWRQGLIGLVTQVLFFPVLFLAFIVLLVSIIGIPLLVLLPIVCFLAVLGAFLGFVAVAEQVGTWVGARFGWNLPSRYALAAIGLVGIYAVSLFAGFLGVFGGPIGFIALLFAVLGLCVVYAAWTVGFGAAVSTRLGTQDRWQPFSGRGGSSIPLVPPPAPVAPMAHITQTPPPPSAADAETIPGTDPDDPESR